MKFLKQVFPARPKYIIAGAQKAGTTSLYDALSKHPQIVPPAHKELHFFNDQRIPYPDWCSYLSNFPSKLSLRGRYTFEASPSYLFHPTAAVRMAAMRPKPEIIVILRDPVERAFSAWNMYRQFKEESDPWLRSLGEDRCFDEVLDHYLSSNISINWYRDRIDYFGRGLYAAQLRRYIEFFELGHNLHVFFFEELFSGDSEADFFRRIGLESHHGITFKKIHEREKESAMNREARDRLLKFYERQTLN